MVVSFLFITSNTCWNAFRTDWKWTKRLSFAFWWFWDVLFPRTLRVSTNSMLAPLMAPISETRTCPDLKAEISRDLLTEAEISAVLISMVLNSTLGNLDNWVDNSLDNLKGMTDLLAGSRRSNLKKIQRAGRSLL
ncbi:hypothetical protein JTE90_019915 [Oedothorax gibbosus]|uniref:Uncharacterized protein n=1 Tax=Oedothorax gibbosus TaxID=931172 RepID=A0AAV6USG1_9ARAC|nr:hypothetical protein JTE90_019915 [Oedothorax gibbosus]